MGRPHTPRLGKCEGASALTFLALLVLTGAARAEDASLAGTWSATALTAQWNVGDWGPACGPRPAGGGEPAGTVTIAMEGNELLMSGLGRTYRTTECWEQFPGLSRTGHTVGSGVYRTSCRSAPGDPRQARITTSVIANNSLITFDETGAYQFVIKGQNCTASVRRTRFFRRVQAPAAPSSASAAATAVPQSPAAATTTTTAREPRASACGTLGRPARIELRPSRKLLRPGESATFRAAVLDDKGCALTAAPTFRIVGDSAALTLSGTATVSVAESAPEGEAKLRATLGGRAVEAVIQIVTRERYDALLAEGAFDATGATTEAAVARLESGSVGARSTVIEDTAGRRRTLFVGVVGGAALLIGLLGLVLLRKGRRDTPPSTPRSAASQAGAAPGRVMVCPTCREEYPPEARHCPRDANRLVPLEVIAGPTPSGAVCPVCGRGFDPGVSICPQHEEPLVPAAAFAARQLETPQDSRKICPTCGEQYEGPVRFCGKCGVALVPVN